MPQALGVGDGAKAGYAALSMTDLATEDSPDSANKQPFRAVRPLHYYCSTAISRLFYKPGTVQYSIFHSKSTTYV